jgi:hypothetical protein
MLSRRGPSLPDTALIIALSCTTLTSSPPSTCTYVLLPAISASHQHPLTSLTQYTLAFRSPIALSSYHPNPTHESSAPGRGLMPGGAGQLSSGGGGQGRGAGAVTAEPSWVAEHPRRPDPGKVGPPSGCRRSRGCPDAGQAGRCPVRLVQSRRGDVRPTGRADVKRPCVRCPGVRGSQVSGRTGRRCPRRCRRAVRAALDPGVARCGGPPRPGAAGRRAAVSAGGVVACPHRS